MIITSQVPVRATLLLKQLVIGDSQAAQGCFRVQLPSGRYEQVASVSDAVFAGFNGVYARFHSKKALYALEIGSISSDSTWPLVLAEDWDLSRLWYRVGPVFHPAVALMSFCWGDDADAELVVIHIATHDAERRPLRSLPLAISWNTSESVILALTRESRQLSLETVWPFQRARDAGPELKYALFYYIASTGKFLVGERDSPEGELGICARGVDSGEWECFGTAIVESDLAMSPHGNCVAWWELAGPGLQLKMRDLARESTIVLLETEDLSVDPAPTTPSWSPTGRWLLGATYGVMSSTLHIVNVESRRHIEVPCRGLVTLAQFLTEPKWQ